MTTLGPEPELESVTTVRSCLYVLFMYLCVCLCVVASAVQLVNPKTKHWSQQKVITNGKQRCPELEPGA